MTQKKGVLSSKEILDTFKDIRTSLNDPRLRILKARIQQSIEYKLYKQKRINTSSKILPKRLVPK